MLGSGGDRPRVHQPCCDCAHMLASLRKEVHNRRRISQDTQAQSDLPRYRASFEPRKYALARRACQDLPKARDLHFYYELARAWVTGRATMRLRSSHPTSLRMARIEPTTGKSPCTTWQVDSMHLL